MNFSWILSPLTAYATVLVVLSVCLALFVSSKMEIARLRSQNAPAGEPEAANIAALAEEVTRLNQSVRSLEASTAQVPLPTGSGINWTKRTQVIKMYTRGEAVATISAALQMPSSEVELMLKVHRILTNPDK